MANLTGAATKFHWVIEQGELVTLRVPVLDAASAPFAVTGWSVDAKVKDGPGGAVLYTWPSGDIAVSGTNVDLTIPAAVSLAWTFRYGWWRLVVQHPSDSTQRHRIAEGRISIRRD